MAFPTYTDLYMAAFTGGMANPELTRMYPDEFAEFCHGRAIAALKQIIKPIPINEFNGKNDG